MDMPWFNRSLDKPVFFRPTATVGIISSGFSTLFFFKRGVMYFLFNVFDQVPGSCIYLFSSVLTGGKKSPTDSKALVKVNGVNESTEKSTDSETSGKKSTSDEKPNSPQYPGGPSLWVWLGPFIGAVGTLCAASIIIFMYTLRNSLASNFHFTYSSPML